MVVGLIARCPSQFVLVLEGASLLGGHAISRDNLSRFSGNVTSLFSGEPLSRTRVDEHHYAQGRRLRVLLFCQPIVAMDFLRSELVMQQGMGNRFLYSQPPSLLGTRKHIDVELEQEPLYQQFCAKITALASHPWKINPETGSMDTCTVRMSPGAKAAWVGFYNKLDLDLDKGSLYLPKTKNGRSRHVVLNDAAIHIFKSAPRMLDSPWIFPGKEPMKPLNNPTKAWHLILAAAGVECCRLHDRRHAFASMLVNEGASLYQVQLLLGHASSVTTQRYAHLDSSTLRNTSQLVSNLVKSC
jgi:hypothetical protein